MIYQPINDDLTVLAGGLVYVIVFAVLVILYLLGKKSSSEGSSSEFDGVLQIPKAGHKRFQWDISLLKSLDWKLFEELTVLIFKDKGYRAELTPMGEDGGLDVMLYLEGESVVYSTAQCKCWTNKQMSVKEMREFLS